MSTINDNDQFLVQRGSNSYKQSAKDLMSTIDDNDLMLVQRGTDSYKVTCKDVKDQLGGGGGGGGFSSVTITPLTITPETSGQYLTCTTDIPKVDGVVPADVVWTWYLYDGATGDAGKTVLKTLTNRENIDTLLLPASAAGSYIGCSVEYLAVTIDETQRCAVGTPVGPVADMHGLRFDNTRITNLRRSGQIEAFTVSVWVKPATISTASQYIVAGLQNRAAIVIDNSLNVSATGTLSFGTLSANSWNHIVVTYDGNDTQGWVNNVEGTMSGAGSGTFFQDGAIVGGNAAGVTAGQNFDGYMSDLYVVDGFVMPPTVFAKQFAAGWGPLDVSVVKANISAFEPESPYDSRANTDQVWSTNVVSSTGGFFGGRPKENMFDGDTSTSCTTDTSAENVSVTVTFSSPLTFTDKVEVWAINSNEVSVSGKDPFALTSSQGWETVATGGGTISSIIFRSTSDSQTAGTNAIRADGRVLVDNGVWDNSQNWSQGIGYTYSSQTMSFQAGKGPELMFNGTIDTPAATSKDTGSFIKWNPPAPLNYTSSVEVYTYMGSGYIELNGTQVVDQITTGWQNLKSGSGTISEISVLAGNSDRAVVSAIRVDGVILVDAGAQWNTSQIWSSGTTTGTPFEGAWEYVFNGTTSYDAGVNSFVATYTSSGDISLTFPAALTGTIEVGASSNSGSGTITNEQFVLSDGTTQTVDIGPGPTAYTFENKTNITSITLKQSALGVRLNYIKLNGEVLVDQASFGANGFYLPFDPAQTGANYSSNVSISGGSASGWNNPPSSAFDGMTNTYAQPNANDSDIKFTYSATANTVTVIADGRSQAQEIVLTSSNYPGGDSKTTTSGDIPEYLTWTNVGTLTEIVAKSRASQPAGLVGVQIDGSTLVDHSSIGVDMSGNGNNFYDQNFGVDGNSSQSWGRYLSGGDGTNAQNSNPVSALDGSVSSLYRGSISQEMTFDVTGLGLSGLVEIAGVSNNGVLNFNINDGAASGTVQATDQIPCFFSSTGFTGTLNKLTIVSTSGNYNLAAIRVGGQILRDPSSTDQVLDTPMKNYSVLLNGFNGNLISSGNTSSVLNAQDKAIYYEAVAGTGSTHITVYSGDRSSGVYVRNDKNKSGLTLVDGTESSWSPGDILGICFDDNNDTLAFFNNGVYQCTYSINTAQFNDSKRYLGLNSGTAASIHNFGQQPFVYTPPAGYESLYQTWSQWVGYLLTARLAEDEERISYLEQVIIAQSVPFEKDKVYQKGDIVDFGGNLLEALVDGADITRSDLFRRRFGTAVDQVEWADLEIRTRGIALPSRPEQPTTLPSPDDSTPPVIDSGSADWVDSGSADWAEDASVFMDQPRRRRA